MLRLQRISSLKGLIFEVQILNFEVLFVLTVSEGTIRRVRGVRMCILCDSSLNLCEHLLRRPML